MTIFKNLMLYYFLVLATIIITILFSSNEPRGSDQFWYLADAYSVANGNWTSNNFFPNTSIANENSSPSFVQNRPIVYFAGLLTYFGFDAAFAYKFINILSLSLIILCFKKILIHSNLPKSSIMFFIALLLVPPATIWSLFNPLTQVFDALLFSLIFYFIHSLGASINTDISKSLNYLFYLILVSAIAVFQRQDFIIFLFVFSLFMLLKFPEKTFDLLLIKRRLSFIILYLASLFLIKLLITLPSHLNSSIPSWGVYTFGSANDWGNMALYFADNSFFDSFELINHLQIKFKLFIAVFFSFDALKTPLLFVFFFSSILSIFSIGNSKISLFYIIYFLVLTLILLIMFFFQFQYRYLFFAYPIAIYVLITTRPAIYFQNKFNGLLNLFLCFSMVLSLSMLYHSNKKLNIDIELAHTFLQSLPSSNSFGGNVLALWDGGESLSIGYNYPTSKVFYITPSTLDRFFWDDISIVLDKNGQIKNSNPNIFIGFNKIKDIQGGWEVWSKIR